jgi:hypothetical protein
MERERCRVERRTLLWCKLVFVIYEICDCVLPCSAPTILSDYPNCRQTNIGRTTEPQYSHKGFDLALVTGNGRKVDLNLLS